MDGYTLDMFLEEMNAEGLGGMLIFYAVYLVVMLAIGIASYVLQSLSCYTIAKRREINRPWLAWIPVFSVWIQGSLSDQYQYVAKGRIKSKRKSLLVLNIMLWTVTATFLFSLFTFVAQAISLESATEEMLTEAVYLRVANSLIGVLGLGVVLFALEIALLVIRYMALYDLYTSCDPKNGVIYLVLSILFSITQPIFLFICRNQDQGMPPRKQNSDPYTPPQFQQPPRGALGR